MIVQVCIDESYRGDRDAPHFCMAAVISTDEKWANFSAEWERKLKSEPYPIPAFKYAKIKKRFDVAKKSKVSKLAKILNKHCLYVATINVDYPHYTERVGVFKNKSTKNPYFLASQLLIHKIAQFLWDVGLREQFEVIFDVNETCFHRFNGNYPGLLELFEEYGHDFLSILPRTLTQRDDEDFLPLQAADLCAGIARDYFEDQESELAEFVKARISNIDEIPGRSFVDSEFIDNATEQLWEEEGHTLERAN